MNSPVSGPGKDERLIADGVDEEPVENTRRLFTGRPMIAVSALATFYAAFHIAALNGLSVSGLTGGRIDMSFLPSFPMETWTFRISHVAGAVSPNGPNGKAGSASASPAC